MLALLICRDRDCRAAYEVEGSRRDIAAFKCEDCGGDVKAVGWADAEPRHSGDDRLAVTRRAA